MYVIKVKGKDEYYRNSSGGFTENLNEAKTFNKTGGANNCLNNIKYWESAYGKDVVDYEVVEVEIKIK